MQRTVERFHASILVALPMATAMLIAVPVTTLAQSRPIAFVDVNVLPMDREHVLEQQTLIVRNGRIVAVGPSGSTDVPSEAMHIEGTGKYLMPGLAEMHGHLPGSFPGFPDRWAADVLFLYIANGVTTVRGMQGNEQHLQLKTRIEDGTILGPRLYVASPQFGGRGSQAVTSPEEGARLVRQYKESGFDLLKIQEGLRHDVYSTVASTATQVGIEFAGHVPDDVGFFRALEAGQITIDHMDNMLEAINGEESRIPEVVNAMVQKSAWAVPTEVLWEVFLLAPTPEELLDTRTELRYVPAELRDRWVQSQRQRARSKDNPEERQRIVRLRRRLLKALSDANAGILLGTDSPQLFSVPGFSIHREMRVMVASGMTPYEVLRSGTRRVAEYFGTQQTTGTIAVGKRADLILVNDNPLENVANIAKRSGVMVNGRWLSEDEIQERLSEIERAYGGNRE